MTKNANMILRIVGSSNEHLTAEQIYLKMIEITGKISLATIYNNLNLLHQQGLIRKLTLGDGPERYDRIVRHDHMICRKCGRLSDVTMQDMTKEIEKFAGVRIESYDLKIYYICEECRKKIDGNGKEDRHDI